MIFEVSGAEGDSMKIEHLKNIRATEKATVTVYIEGGITITRISGESSSGIIVDPKKAGDVSYETYPAEFINKGVFETKVVTPTAKYYCIKHPRNRKLDCDTMRLAKDEWDVVPIRHFLFVAKGSCTIKEKTFSAPELISADSGYVTVKATTDFLGIVIRKI